MTTKPSPVDQHYRSAKEHLAGVKAGQAWRQELVAAHITKHPVPVAPAPAGKENQS